MKTVAPINKVVITPPASSATLTLADGKTLTVNNTITIIGTDGTSMTFPSTSATIARTDAANTFTGVQTFSTPIAVGSVATMTATVGGGVPTPPNNTTTFLRGDGTFAAPTGGGITWSEVTGTSQTAAVDNGYITNNAGLVTVTLPSTAVVGKIVRVAGKGAGGWKIAQNASGKIYISGQTTTTGTGGYLASSNTHDAVELVCIVANNEWETISMVGNITYV